MIVFGSPNIRLNDVDIFALDGPAPMTLVSCNPPAHTVALSANVDRLWLPPLSLRACVRCAMSRDIRGLQFDAAQRLSFYPATALCCITWWFSGTGEVLQPPNLQATSNVVFSGPYTQPSVVRTSPNAHGMMLLLMPDMLHQLTGIEPSNFLNRAVNAEDVFKPDWLRMCEAVLALPDDEARVETIYAFLEIQCRAHKLLSAPVTQQLGHWVNALGLRAAASTKGRSLRQIERRVKQWAGLPMRELHMLARAETAFFKILNAEPLDDFSWAAVAHDAGYADQSHLCRVTKRVTGFSPEDLRRRMRTQEGFWVYRLWE
jgi:AraC-like DNA-binding protein